MPADSGAPGALSAFRPGDEEALLSLEWLAAEPYLSFVHDDEASARAASRLLLEKGTAEFAPSHCVFARAPEGSLAGMMAILTKPELAQERLRAAMVLRRAGVFAEGALATRRASLAAEALRKPLAGELYISRFAVFAEHRGRGLGKLLLAEADRIAHERGAQRIVLEVSPRHREAVGLYLRHGFVEEKTARASDPESGRELIYHHMAREIGSPA